MVNWPSLPLATRSGMGAEYLKPDKQMKIRAITDRLQHEADALTGADMKDTTYTSQNTFPDEATAQEAFRRSVEKLVDVDGWSDLSMFTADFQLNDSTGKPKPGGHPEIGDYIHIVLPGPMPENWVQVTNMATEAERVEFTVQPSRDPREPESDEIKHFFQQHARSTFRVELAGTAIKASEIGEDEAINNQGPQAGDRPVINTVVAEGGWLFYQKIQWKLLTDYLVHL
ncbi:MAG: hypothetical protein JWP57_2680 [Spirosoma sp.]|nr:hypothetical protein [Spirosoma sp.]